MTCNIYPGWLLNGSLTAMEGPANLRAGAAVFAVADAEQMRTTLWTFPGRYGRWEHPAFSSFVVIQNFQ